MKKLLPLAFLLLPLLSYSQQDNYSEQWKKIESLEARGLVESADSLVTEVLTSASKRKDHIQVIKAKIYHYKFYQINTENSNQFILDDLNSTISSLPAPYKNVMQSYKAMMLEQYYQENRWRSRDRNKTDDPAQGSIDAWDLKTVQDSIHAVYERSLQNEKILISTPAGDIEELLFSNLLNRKYRPTLFDVLAHRALSYYSNTASFTSVNADDEYELNTPDLYSDTPRFIKLTFPEIAGHTSGVKVLKTRQKLETLHFAEKNTEAFVYAQLSRLEYVNSQYTGASKWSLYVEALENLSEQYKNKELQALILLDLAMTYYNRATETDEEGKLLNPDFYTRALNMAEKITMDFPGTDTAQKAYNLISTITNIQLNAKVPANLAPNEPGRIYLSYKSLDTLQLKIFKVEHGFNQKITWRNKDSVILSMYNKESLFEEKIALPLSGDHNTHSTEVLLPRLEKGNYLMVAAGKDLKDGYAYGFMQVTNLTLSKTDFDKYSVYRALNRSSGEALSNVKVEFKFNRGASMVKYTNDTGEIIYQKSRNREGSDAVIVSKDGDTLSTNYWPGYYYDSATDNGDDEPRAKTMLYLDRAIYRPGQKVYFKGVLLQHIKKKTSTVPNTWVEVYVDDPNGEEIQAFRLKTNKYGSFTGEFTLPSSGITGEFEIYAEEDTEEDSHFWDKVMEDGDYDDYGSKISFGVEEYKRPTFEVKFDEIKDSFKPGDTAVVMGKAQSFMGAGINNTNLIYEITRQKLMKRWWYYHYSDPVMVVKDTITTDAESNFRISFAALATGKDLEDEHLLYQYTIKATVTDVSGETREAVTTLKIGHKNLLTSLSLPERVQAGDDLKIGIENTNLNGNPVPVTGKIWIYKLQGPGRIFGDRLWEAPEINLIPEDEFIKLFPEEPYGKNLPSEEWPEGELVYEGEHTNDGTAEIVISVTEEWQSGKYLVKTESNNAGNSATAEKAFEVVNPSDRYLADHQRFSYSIQNSDFEKDGKVELLLQTAYNDLNLEVAAYDGYVQLFKKQVLVNGRELISIPIKGLKGKELDLQIRGVKNNSAISETHRVRLPQANKLLNIETETFRNKIQPGVEETWSFIIKDEKNAVPDAEVLASMYDASLDQFITREWITNPGFGQTHKQFPSFSNTNIGNITSLSGNFPYRHFRPTSRIFDRFELFGFQYSSPNSYQYRNYLSRLKQPENSKALTGNTRGVVTGEDGLPLPGVMVLIKGTRTGTHTNFDGEFALDTKKGDVLVFSYVGYSNYELKVGDKKEIFVVLEEDSSSLDEVVVAGYGVEVMEESVDYATAPAPEVAMMVQGKVAGVTVADDMDGSIRISKTSSLTETVGLIIVDGKPVTSQNLRQEDILSVEILTGEEATALYGIRGVNGVVIITTRQGMDALQNVQARKNLDETAFFMPHITVDRKGRLQFSFTSPEALTRWKLRLLAHTKDWTTGKYEGSVLTQKELSVMPNPPRFLREGDTITFKARVSNLSAETLSGTAILQLFNAVTMEPIDGELGNTENTRNFSITASNAEAVSWQLIIPKGIPAVTYRILARSGDFSDGEENLLPVLTNRMLVKESLPMFVRAGQTKTYEFKNLKDNTSSTLDHHQFSLEYSSNPAWYAIQSLPYLIEFEHDCSEQTFARLYANSVAEHIINSQPKIKAVFDAWQQSGALVSDLEKNEELKSIILAETPWVRDAGSETEKRKRLAQLFDTAKLKTEKEELISRLSRMQNTSGAWPWFSGGRDNYFITRHIVGGLGHLKKLNIEVNDSQIIKRAIDYLDREIVEDERRSKQYNTNPEYFYKNVSHLHYLYVRSFYLEEHPLPVHVQKIADKVLAAQKEDWHLRNLYEKGLLSLVLMKMGEKEKATEILAALKESAVKSEEYGMYWKENISGWFWYRAPIETQALLIEAYTEMGSDENTVEELKIWLLQNKRTNHWPTTKATTEATYALLIQGNDWFQIGDNTDIRLAGKPIAPEKLAETEKEAGTGYLKLNWKGEEIDKSFSSIEVENRNTTAGYGGVYWQYFEDLDKIEVHSESPLNVEKELYLNVSDRNGTSLKRIITETQLKIGDLVTVRLVVRSTADMDYIHLKDMRASGFEPTNVLSGYKYQDGTAYYESTRDAATHFFFDSLNKGTYVLEYTVRANNAGNFSNGITNIESMYAPEFSGHTKGIRVEIKE